MQNKKISLLIGLFVLVGIGVGSYFFIRSTHKVQSPNTNLSNANKSIPNTLKAGEASLEKITINKHSFVVASSVHPFLRPGATATASTIDSLNGVVDPHEGLVRFNSRVLGNKYIVYLQQSGTTVELNGIDIVARKKLPAVTLARLNSATSADGVYTSDNVMDFTINQSASTITFTLRKNVIFDSPEPEGQPQANSTSELWTMTYPDGQLHQIATFPSVQVTSATKDTSAAYDLPLRAFDFQGKYLLEYHFHVSAYDQTTKQLKVLKDVGSNGFQRFSVAPTMDYAVALVYLDRPTVSQTSFDSHGYIIDRTLSLKEFPVSQSDTIQKIVWSPDGSTAMMKYNLKNALVLDVPSFQAKEVATPSGPTLFTTNIYDLLSNDTALLGVEDASATLDEVPTYDPNGLTEMVLWNLNTSMLTKVGNYRTPNYLGQL